MCVYFNLFMHNYCLFVISAEHELYAAYCYVNNMRMYVCTSVNECIILIHTSTYVHTLNHKINAHIVCR